MYETFSRARPYDHINNTRDLMNEILSAGKPPIPIKYPSNNHPIAPNAVIDLMIRCWSTKPKSRPTMKQINEQLNQVLLHELEQEKVVKHDGADIKADTITRVPSLPSSVTTSGGSYLQFLR